MGVALDLLRPGRKGLSTTPPSWRPSSPFAMSLSAMATAASAPPCASKAGAMARSREPLRCSQEQSALHTLIRQRHPTPSYREQSLYRGRTVSPARPRGKGSRSASPSGSFAAPTSNAVKPAHTRSVLIPILPERPDARGGLRVMPAIGVLSIRDTRLRGFLGLVRDGSIIGRCGSHRLSRLACDDNIIGCGCRWGSARLHRLPRDGRGAGRSHRG
jgi:hypothetical protein